MYAAHMENKHPIFFFILKVLEGSGLVNYFEREKVDENYFYQYDNIYEIIYTKKQDLADMLLNIITNHPIHFTHLFVMEYSDDIKKTLPPHTHTHLFNISDRACTGCNE